eukprot:288781-Chlamydomonas_euryale.AAC.1
MTVVKGLVTDGVTICATIHSPSQYTFHLFDNLIMLVKGQVVYFGPTSEATSFAISKCPKVKEMSGGYNDAEFLVDLVTEADRQGKGNEIAEGYYNSSLRERNVAQLDSYISSDQELVLSSDIKVGQNSMIVHALVLSFHVACAVADDHCSLRPVTSSLHTSLADVGRACDQVVHCHAMVLGPAHPDQVPHAKELEGPQLPGPTHRRQDPHRAA